MISTDKQLSSSSRVSEFGRLAHRLRSYGRTTVTNSQKRRKPRVSQQSMKEELSDDYEAVVDGRSSSKIDSKRRKSVFNYSLGLFEGRKAKKATGRRRNDIPSVRLPADYSSWCTERQNLYVELADCAFLK